MPFKISQNLYRIAAGLEKPIQEYLPGDIVWARVQDCPYQLNVIGTKYFNTQIDQWVYTLEPASDKIWQQILADNNVGRFSLGEKIINLQEHQLYKSLDDLSHALISGFVPGETKGPFDKCFQKRKERRN